jgi:hypothetical protein
MASIQPQHISTTMEAGIETTPLIATPMPSATRRYPRQSPFQCANLCASWTSALAKYLPNRQQVTGYFSGFLFALGWWVFIDVSNWKTNNQLGCHIF